MNKDEFQVIYDGSGLANNEIDVRDLAPALLAIGDLLEEANRITYGDNVKVQVNVKGSFKTGSFHIDFSLIQSLADQLSVFCNSEKGVTTAFVLGFLGLNAINGLGLIPLVKWLKNRNIKKLTKTGDGKTTIEVDGDSVTVEDKVIEMYKSVKIRKSLEVVISKPLSRDGVDSFAIKHGDTIVDVEKPEKDYFNLPLIEDEPIEDKEIEMNLQAVNISFLEDNKWRFTDGSAPFFAEVTDFDFLKRVQENKEAFSKDDILRVLVRKKQWIGDTGIKTEYIILKIINHRPAAKQIVLPFEDGKGNSDTK